MVYEKVMTMLRDEEAYTHEQIILALLVHKTPVPPMVEFRSFPAECARHDYSLTCQRAVIEAYCSSLDFRVFVILNGDLSPSFILTHSAKEIALVTTSIVSALTEAWMRSIAMIKYVCV